MIKREHFVNRIRLAGFTFVRQVDRVDLWRQRGSEKRITVPRRDLIPETHVIAALYQCGLSKEEVEKFIAAARC